MSEDVIEQPAAEAAPEPEKVEPPVSEDADLDKFIEEKTIEIPGDTDKLVPLTAVTTAREKLKVEREARRVAEERAAKAPELESQLQQMQQQLNQVAPMAQAYQAALAASQQPEQPTGPTPQDTAALEEIARDYDFYKTDGSLDLDRATRHQARVRKEAQAIAQQTVAPLQQQSQSDRSIAMLRNAKLTTAPDGSKPDPAILDWVWSKIDPEVTSTREGSQQAFAAAMGYAVLLGKTVKAETATTKAKEVIPPPLLTEKSGGRDVETPSLSASDKRYAKELGMTEAQYQKELAEMPAGWGKK